MLIPAAPVAGTTPVGPLLTPVDYAAVCGTAGPQANQATIDEAILLVEIFLTRTLAYGQYTERLFVDRRGFTYPTATPLDVSYTITPMSSLAQGDGVWTGYFTPLPDLPVFTGVVPPQTDVTYAGGFQPWTVKTGPTPPIPPKLRRSICKVAWFMLNPAQLAGMPGGAKSSSAAGVSVSGDLSSMVLSDPQLLRDLKGYQRRDSRSW